MIRELKLGQASLFKLAAGITQTETGLVSGQQVASYVQQHLSSGSTGNWNGGTVTNPVTFNADVIIGYGPPVWIKYSNTNAGCAWDYIPQEAVPTKGQIEEFAHEKKLSRPASGNIGQYLQLTATGPSWSDPPASGSPTPQQRASFYEGYSLPEEWASHNTLPPGWYRVDLLLTSSNGGDALNVLNHRTVISGAVLNVQGLAWGGTDNSSCPYATFNGITWLDMSGASVSRAMASIVQLSFCYLHTAPVSWPGSELNHYSNWNAGSVRYTEILPPGNLHNMTTMAPTEAPTTGPTEPPTQGPTNTPSDAPTAVPASVPVPLNLHPGSK